MAQHAILRLRSRTAARDLADLKQPQVARFNRLKFHFAEMYEQLSHAEIGPFETPFWRRTNAALERVLLPVPPIDFLTNRLIANTMFMSAGGSLLREQIGYVENRLSTERLHEVLEEDLVGRPLLQVQAYRSSHNSVHHLYHLMRFQAATKADWASIRTVVEWGGGYGSLAKIFLRLVDRPATYVIIDTPLFAAVQWLYLASVLGEDSVTVRLGPDGALVADKINLMSVAHAEHLQVRPDLFVSTWALSESSRSAQLLVAERLWFGAPHLLLAFQRDQPLVPDSALTGELAGRAGATIEEVPQLPNNHYAFR